MSYQVLARKWRPRIFREMVGQEHVLQALINALDHNRLHHAYLFTGTRGVGKTTIARILAKCLNCETGVSSEPCGQCSACREIAEGRFVDLIEVDAASRTKVEDTRELLENVQYSPTRGRYKVYLIDEVHMLSNSSFNALLKTLEEPPPHVKFLLATTDPQKLPMTILSRCLQFNLKNMNPERIVNHLKFVLDQEVIPFEDAALWQLGRAADGSMRDALSLTDQAIAYGSGKITDADVATMLGTLDQAAVYDIVTALILSDGKAVLNAVEKMSEQAPDYANALAEMLSMLHRIAIAQALPEAVDDSHGDREKILQLALQMPAEDVQLFYQTALLGRRDLPLAPDSRAGFEMVLLRMLAFKPQGVMEVPTQSLAQPVVVPSVKMSPPASAQSATNSSQPIKQVIEQPIETAISEPYQEATPHEEEVSRQEVIPPKKFEAVAVQTAEKVVFDQVKPEQWPAIYVGLGVTGILQSTIANCQLVACSGNEFHFILDEKNNTLYDPSHQNRLADLLSNYFHERIHAVIQKGVVTEKTPAMIALQYKQERHSNAVNAIKTDPIVLQLIEQFGATLREDTIEPV
jgi:DNA polymerase III subunit gamma/tau